MDKFVDGFVDISTISKICIEILIGQVLILPCAM